jgi:non-specific protein-tyrosine kinase
MSTAQVFVSTPMAASDAGALLSGSSFSQQRVKSYAEIVNSALILDPVIQKLRLQITAKDLAKLVNARVPADTVLLNISATDSNPQRATDIANAVAEQFSVAVESIEGSVTSISGNLVSVSITKKAIPADSPSSPKKNVNLFISFIFGLLLGFGISQLKRSINTTVTSEDDILGLPLLAAIEFDYEANDKPLITQLDRYSSRTESFRSLRTSMRYIAPSIPSKVIAITSAVTEEGKTTTALNLGMSLVQSGCRTILIEADLRRSQFSTYLTELKYSSKPGLSELLNDKKKLTPLKITKNSRQIDNSKLWVIPSGKIPPNPSELLGSPRFDEMIEVLKRKFDYVIIDCPPILPVTDAAIVASKADGVILVVHTGSTKKTELTSSRAAIESVSGKIFGVVLNKIPQTGSGKYGYRYYYQSTYRPLLRSQDEFSMLENIEYLDLLEINKNK